MLMRMRRVAGKRGLVHSAVFVVDLEHISHLVLVFLLFALTT